MVNHSQNHNQYVSSRVLKVNVGFVLAQGNGFSRATTLDIPQRIRFDDDSTLEALSGNLRLTRTSEGVLVQGTLHATQLANCSRCLTATEVNYPLHIEELFATLAHFDSSEFHIGDDNILDLAPLIRDEAVVNIPTQVYCREDCKGLCMYCGHNLNEGPCECETQTIDPRWAVLAELQTKRSEDDVR